MQVAQVAKGTRQVFVDEAEGAPHAFQPHLDENPGRVLDVVAGGLDDTRHLAEFRQDPPSPFRQRRVLEQRLSGKARRQDVA